MHCRSSVWHKGEQKHRGRAYACPVASGYVYLSAHLLCVGWSSVWLLALQPFERAAVSSPFRWEYVSHVMQAFLSFLHCVSSLFCSAMLCVQHSCMHKGVKLLGLCRIFHSIFVILLIWSQLSYLSISALIFISSRRHLPFKSRAGVLFLAGLLAPWTLVQQ